VYYLVVNLGDVMLDVIEQKAELEDAYLTLRCLHLSLLP